jgi:hypothetical protein
VAVKVAEVAPDGTVTEAPGAGNRLLLLVNDTAAPPVGAAVLRVIVHVVAIPEFKLVGLHANDVKTAGAVKLIVTVFETPASVAVKVAL